MLKPIFTSVTRRAAAAAAAAALLTACVGETKPNTLERVRALGLLQQPAVVPAYSSACCRERTAQLQSRIEEATGYFASRLGVRPALYLAVLDEADWARLLAKEGPYGIPWGSDAPHVLVLPARPERSVVAKGFLASASATPGGWKDGDPAAAAVEFVDLIGYHEVGHVVVASSGLRQSQAWFNEMLATYAAYAFMRERHPDLARRWDAMVALSAAAVQPEFRSLDEFNARYGKMPPDTYGWYQSQFHQRVRSTWDALGISLFGKLREEGLGDRVDYLSAAELIERLEPVAPGFKAWAAQAIAAAPAPAAAR